MIRLLAATETMQWIVYAVGALTIVFVVFRPSLRNKKDPLSPSGPKMTMAQQRSVEREMSNLLVELSEMARQISGQLDTRAAKLEALMQEADKKIAELKRLETTQHEQEIKPFEPKPAPLPNDARYSAIYDLADAGHSVQEIAQQLARPRGEVELILALRTPSESRS
jgi:hypothetical protein